MTSSNVSTMGGMAGGALVVSSSQVNKPLFGGGHPQQHPQAMPNGPMMSRVSMQHMQQQQRGGPAGALHLGPRLQGPASGGLMGMPQQQYGGYATAAGGQGLPVGE